MEIVEIVLMAVVTSLLMALLHYLPWRGLLRRELPVLARYMIGVLGLTTPLSVVWILRSDWTNLLLLWVAVICGGLTVIVTHVRKDGSSVARPTKANELKREQLEAQLTCLGCALVLIDLVHHRIGSAITITYSGLSNMLSPGIEDLDRIKALLVETQVMIKEYNPDVFAVGGCSDDQ
ncbi:MAG TPA: hypothetical protein PLR56_09175 [Brevefilum sp.]|nr:hypothetical protein [Brevefilum sp.]